MDANIFVAEHISFREDGTFTLVRGGIDQFWGKPGEVVPVAGRLFVMLHAERYEEGTHDFKLTVLDLDGNRIAPDIEGEFHVPQGGGKTKFQVPFRFEIDDPGKYEFGFSINGELKSRWGFQAEHKTSHE